ncbi:MAG: FAD-dependent oxidoreductase [Deltaproteobacteria bacterium]|nr:FAD-dependent oxidoreductase [Deltaproteobacteria bacterium]MBW2448370.1 FAD-dependent oxidoreductase [Deltaproteobacteria bacterium]
MESPAACSLRDIEAWDAECDVLVVGLGCAGASAALAAAEAGADVLALERASAGGGTSALSGGVVYLGGGTPVQKACGFEDDAEAMRGYLMAACGPDPDEAKISLFAERSVEHFHWLVDRGVPFRESFYPDTGIEPPTDDGLIWSGNENVHPFRDLARPAPRGHCVAKPGAAGGLLMEKLLARVGATPGIRVTNDTCAESVVCDEEGRVVGAIVRRAGERANLKARRGVVLTAGGFIQNREMIAEHAPPLLRCKIRIGCEGDDGSGIQMGLAAGAAARRLDAGSISLPYYPPEGLKRGILVNGAGERFLNEDAYYGLVGEHALLRHDGRVFLVVDDAVHERPMAGMEIVAAGDDPAELARELDLPGLEATIHSYNEAAARGIDPAFHKNAKYLAPLVNAPLGVLDCTVENAIYAAFTLGGLATDVEGRVLDEGDAPIGGLFAAGRTTSGLAAQGYSSGLSLADGTFFGRRAGERAAAGGAER